MWNRSALVEVLCCYGPSWFYFKDFQGVPGWCWSLPLFHPCFQCLDNESFKKNFQVSSFATENPFRNNQRIFWNQAHLICQLHSRYEVMRGHTNVMSTFKWKTSLNIYRIGVHKNGCKCSQTHSHFFSNLNISIKHRQIGEQSVRFGLHKRFSITVGCMISTVHRFFKRKCK